MLQELSEEQQKEILSKCWDQCLRTHLCGNYIHINGEDIEWWVDYAFMGFRCLIETDDPLFLKSVFHKYDFDFSFDSNLQEFIEKIERSQNVC